MAFKTTFLLVLCTVIMSAWASAPGSKSKYDAVELSDKSRPVAVGRTFFGYGDDDDGEDDYGHGHGGGGTEALETMMEKKKGFVQTKEAVVEAKEAVVVMEAEGAAVAEKEAVVEAE